MFRRMGRPGLLGTIARTAVVAGTATATAGAVNRHAQKKAAEKQALADQEAEQQQPVYQAPPPGYQGSPQGYQAAPSPASSGDDLISKIQELAGLRDSGVLTDAEFAAAKSKLLGT